jgi:fibronectin type 3 domain-containing protein
MSPPWALVATLLAALTVLGALAPAAESASIAPEPAKLAEALVGASGAHFGDKTYLFGGRLKDGSYSDKVSMYDPAAGSLTVVASLPTPVLGGGAGRYSGAAAAVGAKIYYFGGATLVSVDLNNDGNPENVPKASRDIVEFDPATRNVRTISDKLPTGAWGMSAVESSGYVYLFGGFTFDPTDLAATTRHDRVLRFAAGASEGSSQRVRELATSLPYAVQDAAAAKVGNRILVMGGLSDHHETHNPCPTYSYYDSQSGEQQTNQVSVCLTKRIVSFDPTTNSEITIGIAGELPYRAQFITAAVVQNKAYVPGGLFTDSTAGSSIVEISLSERNEAITRVITPVLPQGAFGQAVVSDGSNLLVFGGRTGSETQLTDEIVRLDPRVTPPWAPRSATASDATGAVRLSWEAPSYNGDGGITGYRIYRSAVDSEEERLAEVTSLTYEDASIRPGVEYVWRITAVNAAGESSTSARVTRSSGLAVPGIVTAFQGFPANDQVVLRWLPPDETGGSNLTGYRILRNGVLLASAPPDGTEHIDTTALNGETYAYQVRAFNVKGDGASSEIVRVTPAPVPPTPAGLASEVVPVTEDQGAVRLTWFAPGEAVDNYIVYRSALPGRAGTLLGTVASTTFTDEAVERGRTYYYAVAAENTAGRSPPSTETRISLVRTPGAPTEVAALGMEGEIRVSWAAPADTGDAPPDTLRYVVNRGTGDAAPRPYKTDLETPVFTDRLVTPGQSYTYTVTTLNPMASTQSVGATATARALVNRAPAAILAILPPLTNAGDPVELDASQSGDVDGTIKSYLFDFGDGTDPVSTTQPTVTHQYAFNGTYAAKVIVTDNRNEVSAPAIAQVIVGEVITDKVEGTLPGSLGGGSTTGAVAEPGSGNPAIPGPGLMLVLLGVAAVALARRHRAR